jgi:hypothetical protein
MWARDLRVAIRFGFSATAFSGTVVAVLGIAIAGATATFSVAYHVLLARSHTLAGKYAIWHSILHGRVVRDNAM